MKSTSMTRNPDTGARASRYSARHYNDAAGIVCEIDAGLEALGYALPARNDICELVRARFAHTFAQDNPKFDSFRFSNAARRSGAWDIPRKMTFE
jgi:hypothetical protein